MSKPPFEVGDEVRFVRPESFPGRTGIVLSINYKAESAHVRISSSYSANEYWRYLRPVDEFGVWVQQVRQSDPGSN